LKFLKGIEKRIFKVIGDFKISMISQGASLINISFVVENNDLEVVIKNLHKEFFLNEKNISYWLRKNGEND